jgi:hypothetical protein
MMRTFDEDIAPRIRSSYAGIGQAFSSKRADAERKALEGIGSSISQQLAQTNLALEEGMINRQLQATPLAMQRSLFPYTKGSAYFSSLAPFQDYEQSKYSADYEEFLRTRPENSPYLSAALSYLGQPHTLSYVEKKEGPLSMAAKAAGIASSLMGKGGMFGAGGRFGP